MSTSAELLARIEQYFATHPGIIVKKMFGGHCFMLNGNMCCGVVKERLMARIGPDAYEAALQEQWVSEMNFTGKPMRGMIYIAAEGIESDAQLHNWLKRCENFAESLEPK